MLISDLPTPVGPKTTIKVCILIICVEHKDRHLYKKEGDFKSPFVMRPFPQKPHNSLPDRRNFYTIRSNPEEQPQDYHNH
jgi:hypothetical protein